MKKILCILTLMTLFVVGCSAQTTTDSQKTSDSQSDAQKFKEEYESLNGTVREKDGKTIRSITIPEDNSFTYCTADELIEKMENKETFIVYFGFADCPWCRSVLPTFIDVMKEKDFNNLYYVDISEIRDTKELDDTGNITTTTEGSKGYQKLLEKLDSVLDEYTIGDDEVDAGEKRIYAPNFVVVLNGEPTYKSECISALETDGYMELSDEIIKDMKQQVEDLYAKVSEISACDVKC